MQRWLVRVLLTRGMLSNASFARLLDGGGQSAIGVCFKRETVFRAGSAVVVCLIGRNDQEMSSPISGPHSGWNAHEDSAVANALVDSW